MKISAIKTLAIPEITVIRFDRFQDHRGYFTETYRESDIRSACKLFENIGFPQISEGFSRPNTVRGLHFQWNPYMGKLVRTVRGRMIDLALDIRKHSPTFGKILAYDMPDDSAAGYAEWIWLPPGFAHGNFFTEETVIEYLCSGEYSPGCEAGISPLAPDIDWSLCDKTLKRLFDSTRNSSPLMTDKDRNGLTLNAWLADSRSDNFIYGKI